jgi:ribosomal protein L11 methylase PrmA
MAERERILARLRADGVLVIAGILEREFAQVQRSFESAGLRRIASRRQNEWRCGAFCRPGAVRPPA